MERYFILDKYNTFYDWDLILTSKDITPPKAKTNLVNIDGADGSLDLSESLAGRVIYQDRTITASFWTDKGKYRDRDKMLRAVENALHGRKIKVIEPDDPDHYFIGRLSVTKYTNNLAYMTFDIEVVCDPWRYSLTDSERSFTTTGDVRTDLVINNTGLKVLCPEIKVTGSVMLYFNGSTTTLTAGSYKITDLKLVPGANAIGVSGTGSVTFKYKEAEL